MHMMFKLSADACRQGSSPCQSSQCQQAKPFVASSTTPCSWRPVSAPQPKCRSGPPPPCWSAKQQQPQQQQSFSVLSTNLKSFSELHPDLVADGLWFAGSPAQGNKATRSDVRLLKEFTTYLKSHKLELQSFFCADPLLSGASAAMCDPSAGRQLELLSEYLTLRSIRVGEQLPNWFVAGSLRGSLKAWMAMARSGQHDSCGIADGGCDGLGAMPSWDNSIAAHIGGWESAPAGASQEDVALLSRFGDAVYCGRLDVGELLWQQWQVQPFQWAEAQVAQGSIEEPEPWLLEKFFMSKHHEGEELPLWFATWGVREHLAQWLDGPEAAQLRMVRQQTAATGSFASAASLSPTGTSSEEDMPGAGAGLSAGEAVTNGLDLLEAAAVALLGPAAACTCARNIALLPDAAPAAPAAADIVAASVPGLARAASPAAADLLVTSAKGTALLVAAAWVGSADSSSAGPYGCGAEAAVRQAKERLDWQGWLLVQGQGQRGGPGVGHGSNQVQYEPGQVTKLVLLVAGSGRAGSAKVNSSVLRYLQHCGVRWLGDWEVAAGPEAAALALEEVLGGALAASKRQQQQQGRTAS